MSLIVLIAAAWLPPTGFDWTLVPEGTRIAYHVAVGALFMAAIADACRWIIKPWWP